jgi:hypothetical protein
MRSAFVSIVATALSSTAKAWCDPVEAAFSSSPIVALVQVKESTFPKAYLAEDRITSVNAAATLVVIASWKGPYHFGSTLRAIQPQICAGYPCLTYPFQVGEVVLVFAREYGEPIAPSPNSVVKESEADSLMTQLYRLSWASDGDLTIVGGCRDYSAVSPQALQGIVRPRLP